MMEADPAENAHPVAVIAGQYSSYVKQFSPYDLKCLPLGTVMRGPAFGEEYNTEDLNRRKRRAHQLHRSVESSQSDSDEDDSSSSSSDDSSSDSSDDSDSSSSSSDDDDDESDDEKSKCKLCAGDRRRNKDGKHEPLVRCAQCHSEGHLTCWDLDVEMLSQIRAYPWQCNDCKTCQQCRDPADEDKMLFCDYCDRGYHIVSLILSVYRVITKFDCSSVLRGST